MSQSIATDIHGRETSAASSTFRRTFAKVLKYLNNNCGCKPSRDGVGTHQGALDLL
jgi:hypothetical protein